MKSCYNLHINNILLRTFVCLTFLCCLSTTVAASNNKPELVLQYSHTDRLYNMAFAEHAPVFVSVSQDGYIDIWNTRDWILKRTIFTGTERCYGNYNTNGIALSPDGKFIAYMTDSGKVQIWDAGSGKLVKKLPKPVGWPISVKWSSDGKRLAVGGDYAVRIWDVGNLKVVRTFLASGDVAFSPDGKLIGIANENRAYVFDIASGRKLYSLRDKAASSWPITFSPDGKYVATGGEDPDWDSMGVPKDEDGSAYNESGSPINHERKVKIWDVRTGKLIKMLPGYNALDFGALNLQFTPDSTVMFSAGAGAATLWNINSATSIRTFDMGYYISPNGRMLVCADSRIVLNANTGQKLAQLPSPPAPVEFIAFSPDGKLIAAVDETRDSTSLRLWNVRSGQLNHALEGPPRNLHYVGFLPGNKVLSRGWNGTFKWDSLNGKLLAKYKPNDFTRGIKSRQSSLLTPDSCRTISDPDKDFNGTYYVRDAKSHKLISIIRSKLRTSLEHASISPNSRYFALWAYPKAQKASVTVWDINTGRRISSLQGIDRDNAILLFSSNSKSIIGSLYPLSPGAGETPNRMVIWDVASGRIKHQLLLGKEPANSLIYSANKQALICRIGPSICLFNPKSLNRIYTMNSGTSRITTLAFSSGVRLAASGHEDGTIKLWNLNSRKLIMTMQGFGSADNKKVSQDWLTHTADGRYNWSKGAASLIKWRYKGQLYPAERFEKQMRSK